MVDTNIIIDHLRQGVASSALVKLQLKYPDEELAISLVTIQELYEGKSVNDREKEKELLATLAGFVVLPYNYETAKEAGKINRNLKNNIESFDAAIAATCLVNDCHLATFNQKDFTRIEGLKIVEV